MKRLQLAVVAMFVTAFTAGCGVAGKEFTVKRTFDVHANATDNRCQTSRIAVNLTEDSAFNDLKKNIGKVEVRKVVVSVVNPKTAEDSVATSANGHVRVSDAATGSATELGTYADVPLSLGSSQQVSFDAAAAASLAKLVLNPPNTFYVEAEGCSDAVPAHYQFQAELTLYAELKLF